VDINEDGRPEVEAVSLQRATVDVAPVLANLMELYIHDMSEIFHVTVGPDGRFGYEPLQLYWTEPDSRFAFLIKADNQLAGFALVTRGSPASDDPEDLDVAEFFVLRAYRRSGVGRRAAIALWNSVPGQWVVRVSEANRSGVPFWRKIIQSYTSGAFVERTRPGEPHSWRVFRFGSTSHPAAC
jgi:predicted acetyltransferase